MPTALLVALALAGFAANSLLCRQALLATAIDPATFTAVRIATGAAMLALLVMLRGRGAARGGVDGDGDSGGRGDCGAGGGGAADADGNANANANANAKDHAKANADAQREGGGAGRTPLRASGDWRGALALFVYAIAFAQAYVALDAGLGALLLFGAVQLTMLAAARLRGERFAPRQWLGFTLAALGLCAMKLPLGGNAPPWDATLAMLLAGVAWGLYSLLGRDVDAPLRHTAGNFLLAAPLAILFVVFDPSPLITEAPLPLPWDGIAYATLSGALASGVGYALWYAALPRLLASQAALLQLLVPVLAALGGIAFLHESPDLRLLLGGTAILGGVYLALYRGVRTR